MELFDKIFLINLPRRKDRLEFMKYKLDKENIHNYELISATDGYNEDTIKIFDMYKNIKYYYGIITSPGAIGLLYTWKELLNKCIENNYQKILILEDDIYFHKNLKLLHDNNLNLYNTYDVVSLGGNQPKWDDTQIDQLKKDTGYYNYSSNKWFCTYGTYSISLNYKAIKLIYDAINTNFNQTTMTIDVTINSLIRDGQLSGVIMYPNLVIPEMRDSDNMGPRNMKDLSLTHKWIIDDYKYVNYYDEILTLRTNRINPRSNGKITVGDLTKTQLLNIYDGSQLPCVVIIPSHNNDKWVKKNIMSVINQDYYNWRVIFIDDCSEDTTYTKALEIVNSNNMNGSFTFVRNSVRKYQTYNRHRAYMSCYPEEICVMLDGDDWLAHDYVLNVLNYEYTKHNLLVSYGQFAYFDNNRITFISGKYEFPENTIRDNSYRKYNWISQHLRTVKARVMHNIPEYQLKDENGDWLTKCSDMAEMFWALENSNGRHKNIGSLLYIYNKDSSISRSNSYYTDNTKEREQLINYIRSHPKPEISNTANPTEFSQSDKLPEITYVANYKHNYEIEFTQRETFIVPCDFHITHNYVFSIYVTVMDNHTYNFSINSPNNMFNISNSTKSGNCEYILQVISTLPFSELEIYTFNISANCTTCLKNNLSSKNFSVYTYRSFTRIETRPRINVQILPSLHNQTCNIIGQSTWNLVDFHRLVKCNHKTRATYRIPLRFNEKTMTIIIEIYDVPTNVCTIL